MSALALAGALVTVSAKNPIRGAVGLLFTIVGIAALFVRLNAEFMAAIQLIVYAGAVVVLFVVVIMLLGPDAASAPNSARYRRSSPRGWTDYSRLSALAASLFSLATSGFAPHDRRPNYLFIPPIAIDYPLFNSP
jgi:NADH:ubiquinone oxidoreductase subunit 6 (subunit J)